MSRLRSSLLLGLVGLAASSAWPQSFQDQEPVQPPPGQQQVPSAGFWPTQKMMERIIDRMTEELGKTYSFDDDQLDRTRGLFKARFPTWMNENRGEIMDLTNQYFETLLGGQAPDAIEVAAWAQRTLPLLNGFVDQVEGVTGEMRTYLTDDQQTMLDGHMAAFRVGMSYIGQRVGTWSQGGFDPNTEWPDSPGFNDAEHQRSTEMMEAQQRAEREAQGLPPEEPPAPRSKVGAGAGGAAKTTQPAATTKPASGKDEWAQYTEDFIRRYELNEDQKALAHKALKLRQEERDKYLRNVSAELDELNHKIKEAATPDEKAASEASRARMTRPLDRMFATLKDQLDRIPTRAQRVAAAKTELNKAQQPKPATTQKTTER